MDQVNDLNLHISLANHCIKVGSSRLNFLQLVLAQGWVPLGQVERTMQFFE